MQVAKLLLLKADGAFAEEIHSDLATALLARPANVLSLMQTNRSVTSTVCSAPFPSPGKRWLIRYKSRAIRSVESVRKPSLSRFRDHCLRALRSVDLSQPAELYE